MTSSQGIEGTGNFPIILPASSSSQEKVTWNAKQVSSITDNLTEISNRVVSAVSDRNEFIANAQELDRLVSQLSDIVHFVDEATIDDIELSRNINSVISSHIDSISDALASQKELTEHKVFQSVSSQVAELADYHKEASRSIQTEPTTVKTTITTPNQIQEIPSNHKVSEGLVQALVLSQYEDTTNSGFENCGYHALKNALVALIPQASAHDLEKMLNNKDVFFLFYKYYCTPEIQARNLDKGKTDASIIILRDVIDRFSNDPECPKMLLPLQDALRESNMNDSLAIFQMTTTTGDDRGLPLFGFFDAGGAEAALKLYRLTSEPGPQTLSCVFGNEVIGHWYTLVIQKSQTGEINFVGMDSMDNAHNNLGQLSALSRLSSLVKSNIGSSESFLKKAFAPFDEFISPRANWFAADGSIPSDYEQSLLDDKPVPALASVHAPTGSTLERNLHHCIQTYAFIDQAGWFSSDDYWIQSKIVDLEKLVIFYAERLPPSHPQKEKLENLAKVIGEKKRSNFIEYLFQKYIFEIEEMKGSLTPTQFSKFIETFKSMQTLYLERKKIAAISSEHERIAFMNTTEKGPIGVEQGFTSGTKAKDIEGSLKEKVGILFMTYQEAKKRNEIDKLIVNVASGDGCLTARMGRVNMMFTEYQEFGDVQEILSAEVIGMGPVTSISELIDDLANEFILKKAQEVLDLISEESISDNPEQTALKIKEYATGELGQPFRKFLIKKGILENPNSGEAIPEAHEINWVEALPSILKNKNAIEIFINGTPNVVYGDKEKRYVVEVKGMISRMRPEDFLRSENFDRIISKFRNFCQGNTAKPLHDFLINKGVIPDVKPIDWAKHMMAIINLEQFNNWLASGKIESLRWFE